MLDSLVPLGRNAKHHPSLLLLAASLPFPPPSVVVVVVVMGTNYQRAENVPIMCCHPIAILICSQHGLGVDGTLAERERCMG